MPEAPCEDTHHASMWPCPLHGCPDCAAPELTHGDPEAYEPPVDRSDPVWELLSDLAEHFVDNTVGCLICTEIQTRSAWSAYPGWECELSDCLHCEECGLCMKTGRVCRHCRRCAEHQEEMGEACERTRWSRSLLEDVTYFVHSFYNPQTRRWG